LSWAAGDVGDADGPGGGRDVGECPNIQMMGELRQQFSVAVALNACTIRHTL